MTHTIAIPVMGKPHELKGVVAGIEKLAHDYDEFLIIDNSIQESDRVAWYTFIHKYLKPKNLKYICNSGNIGMVATLNQIYKESIGDIISILHSDLFIYTDGWDGIITNLFEDDGEIGLAGFFGQRGITHGGGRVDTLSNMVEAEIHGRRVVDDTPYIITVDGFSIIVRREMLDKMGGFDNDYIYHHHYDKNIGLDCYNVGYKAVMAPISVHHWNGMSANQPDYQDWISEKMGVVEGGDLLTHRKNAEILNAKWGHCLPLTVNDNGELNRPITKLEYAGNRE